MKAKRALAVSMGILLIGTAAPRVSAGVVSQEAASTLATAGGQTLDDAQRLFYNAQFEAAAALAAALRGSKPADLPNEELRTSALLFQLRRLLEGRRDLNRDSALRECTRCPALLETFMTDIRDGQNLARTMLRDNPADDQTLFYLAKLDLNYVWLNLGVLGRRTGWSEYWEARRSLDGLLKRTPDDVRARVARAWMDYIVDTRVPWATRWLFGGGNRKRAMAAVADASELTADPFSHAEAMFALWHMQVRERDLEGATKIAEQIARDFPNNHEVARFLKNRQTVEDK